jgi:hypothetical protein
VSLFTATMRVPSQALVPPDTRAAVSAEVTRITRSVWQGRTRRLTERPAFLVVVGAKGVTGVRHLLLGSVAEGALNRSPVPVFIAR